MILVTQQSHLVYWISVLSLFCSSLFLSAPLSNIRKGALRLSGAMPFACPTRATKRNLLFMNKFLPSLTWNIKRPYQERHFFCPVLYTAHTKSYQKFIVKFSEINSLQCIHFHVIVLAFKCFVTSHRSSFHFRLIFTLRIVAYVMIYREDLASLLFFNNLWYLFSFWQDRWTCRAVQSVGGRVQVGVTVRGNALSRGKMCIEIQSLISTLCAYWSQRTVVK